MNLRSALTILLPLAGLVLGSAAAHALSFPVDCIGGETATCATGESQFEVRVQEDELGTLVTFHNAGPNPAFITEVYFADDLGVLGDATVNVGNVGLVSYTDVGVNPNHLPGANHISWDYMAEPTRPGSGKAGVDGGETLGILFDTGFEELSAAIGSGSLVVGLRGQGLYPDDESESFIAAPIPEPGAALLFGLGSAVVASRSRRRR